MRETDSFLHDHTFGDIRVIDCFKQKFDGNTLGHENRMATKKGLRTISVTPLYSYERYSNRSERVVTIKSDLGHKAKVKTASTVEELAHILKDDLGLQILYHAKPL